MRAGTGAPDPGGGRRGGFPHAHAFRLLLRLYPRRFREEYGEEMTRFFLHRLGRARGERGRFGAAALWTRVAADVASTAYAERRRPTPPRQRPTRDQEPMSLLHDLRYAVRRLRTSPGFAFAVVVILGVGIGLNGAVFSLVDALLLRPPPFADPERIVHIYQDSDDGDPSSTSFPAYRDMATTSGIFAGVAATSSGGATWETADGPREAAIEFATASYFPVLGLTPYRGRWFDPEHDRVGAEMAAVVSYRTWRSKMGADPDVVGATVRLNNHPVTVIGVGPPDFNGDAGAVITDFWVSISSTPMGGPFRVSNLDRRQDHWYQVKARLAPGVPLERARAAMAALATRLAEDFPDLNEGRDITVFAHDDVRFHPDADQGIRAVSMGILALAALVLLLACSSLANLLLIRGISRGQEMAVREALGAGRKRVVRLLLLEAFILSGLGGLAGLAIAWWAVQLVPLLPLPAPGAGLDVAFDHRVVLFGILLTMAAGLLFGLLPAIRSARTDVAAALRDEGRGRSVGRGVSVLHGGLVAVQVAVSVVLVVGAGLLARSLANTERVDPGVDAERIAILGTNLQQGGVGEGEAAVVVAQLLDRVEALPGVERAALTTRLPVQRGGTSTQVIEGYQPPSGTGSVELDHATVSRDYFETVGIPLLAGRTFNAEDHPDAPVAMVINEAAARLYFGGDAVGGRVRSEGVDTRWKIVVGVVADAKVSDLREPPTPMIYFSAEQVGVTAFTLVARTAGEPAALTGALRRVIREVRPSLPITRLGPLEEHLGNALAQPRAAAALMGAFSLLALLLAIVGVYAVVSFTVARRSQELGIRVALGATRARLVAMVVGESLTVVAVGVAAGLALTVPAMRGLESMLFGVDAGDGLTFAGAALLLLSAAGAAAFLPARRAAGADPVEVLRNA